jgi:hypothetical protein
MIFVLHVGTDEFDVHQMILRPHVGQEVVMRPLADTPNFFASGLSGLSKGALDRAAAEDAWIVHPDDRSASEA